MFIHRIRAIVFLATLFYGSCKANTNGLSYPTRKVAGISVINTPIVQDAEAFALEHSTYPIYKHVMRSWLYGVLMINANETLSDSIDLEVHAVATLLHDLGWDTTEASPIISADRRFEVDGAFAAREFIQEHQDGKFWHERNVQLVWDAIALHTERSISCFKELDVYRRASQWTFRDQLMVFRERTMLQLPKPFRKVISKTVSTRLSSGFVIRSLRPHMVSNSAAYCVASTDMLQTLGCSLLGRDTLTNMTRRANRELI